MLECNRSIKKKMSMLHRILALVLVVACAAILFAQTAAAKSTYLINDGDRVLLHSTYATDPATILNEVGLPLGEEDTYTTQKGTDFLEIRVQRKQLVTVLHRGRTIYATTYGESVGCVAITRNASVATITTTAIMAILISFVSPFVAFLDSIPGCVMGGVCITLYGFIAVSGLKMIQKVDLEKNRNLFVVSAILIAGIGGLTLTFGKITITAVACALILGIITNLLLSRKSKNED